MISNFWRLLTSALLTAGLSLGLAQTLEEMNDPPPGDWPQHSRDPAATRFSPLDEINVDNVGDLELTWARDLGFQQSVQGTPTAWNGVVFVSTETGVVALDGTNGDEIWTYDSPAEEDWLVSDSAPRAGPVLFDGKVFINTRYGKTVALDQETGEVVWETQVTDPALNEGTSTNPIFGDGKILVGTTGADAGGAPGRVVAMDVEDGEILWTFNAVPLEPDDPVADTWANLPSWEKGLGGAAAWNAGAYDPVTRTVIWGTGQPVPWYRFEGDDLRWSEEPLQELYTSSFVALDVDSGELKWYHQPIPADEWDYDAHRVPIIADIEIDGEERRVAVLGTSSGFLVLIDAESGEFLDWYQMAEESNVHLGYEDDGTPIVDDEMRISEEGTPVTFCPGLRWAHIAPGAFSPETGLWYRPNQDGCVVYTPYARPDDWEPGQRPYDREWGARDDDLWYDRLGALTAIDPATGEVVWEFSHFYGHDAGPVVTAGGLVFTSSADRVFRAFDAQTGDELFRQVLTAASRAGTITYEADGKQYVATLVGYNTPGTGPIPDYDPTADIPPPVAGNAAVFVFSLSDEQ